MTSKPYCAVYDFELMPYALGDVLTWNVQTAIRCEELGRDKVDVYICMDERYPSSIYQWDLITAENSALFFNELFGAFGTHPRLGDLHIYRDRDVMLSKLRELAADDPDTAESISDYEHAVKHREDGNVLVSYFTKYIHSHERINAFALKHGRIPLLRASAGCEPDVAGLITKRLAGRRIVPFHTRLRSLDVGYGGAHTLDRDSDFLEWYEFLRTAAERRPDVQFVALGRLQEKPLEMLKLPNVMSLRTFGLGLGHELTLTLRSHLFMGTSSGFAAMANFSTVPYFITRMNPESCRAYRIEPGIDRLPFATQRQRLVYEPETRELLMRLLEQGLDGNPTNGSPPAPPLNPAIDVRSWEWERSRWLYRLATTYRFFSDDRYADKETAFLLWPKLKEARIAARNGSNESAWAALERIERHFPRMCGQFPEFLQLKLALATGRNDPSAASYCKQRLALLSAQPNVHGPLIGPVVQYLTWGYPFVLKAKYILRRMKYFWRRRHRIPGKIVRIARGLMSRRTQS